MKIKIKRVYEPASDDDGMRILVDRIWPRGITKSRANLDSWMPDIAPSSDLRRWFNHDPEKWTQFTRRYANQLRKNKEGIRTLYEKVAKGPVTLLYAAKDEQHNNAAALRRFLVSSKNQSAGES